MSNTFHQLNDASKRLIVLKNKLIDLYKDADAAKEETGEAEYDYTEIDALEVEIENLEAQIFDLEEEIADESALHERGQFS